MLLFVFVFFFVFLSSSPFPAAAPAAGIVDVGGGVCSELLCPFASYTPSTLAACPCPVLYRRSPLVSSRLFSSRRCINPSLPDRLLAVIIVNPPWHLSKLTPRDLDANHNSRHAASRLPDLGYQTRRSATTRTARFRGEARQSIYCVFTENLLENHNEWGAPTPPVFSVLPCSLGTAACCLLFLLTCALLMTSSHSKARWSPVARGSCACPSWQRRSSCSVAVERWSVKCQWGKWETGNGE